MSEDKIPIPKRDPNPYVDEFLEMVAQICIMIYILLESQVVNHLLSKDTWKVLDYIIEEKKPNDNLQFEVNSNLGAQTN